MATIASCAGCLLYTDPVNTAPKVLAIKMPDVAYRGKTLSITADVQDADGNDLLLEWGSSTIDCPGSADGAPRVKGQSKDQPFSVHVTSLDGICVWVVVRDSHGARDFAFDVIRPQNRPPVADIQLVKPATMPASDGTYPLFSEVRASSKAMDEDKDVLTHRWMLTRPGRPAAAAPSCSDAATDVCFVADPSGTYVLDLFATDGLVEKDSTARLAIKIADDQPPCIVQTDPPIVPERPTLGVNGGRKLTVLRVDDDGDPYPGVPASGISFHWQMRRNRGEWGRVTTSVSDFFATGEVGDVVEMRVQVRDRHDRPVRRDYTACTTADSSRCELKPGCAQWVTWTVVF